MHHTSLGAPALIFYVLLFLLCFPASCCIAALHCDRYATSQDVGYGMYDEVAYDNVVINAYFNKYYPRAVSERGGA